MRGGGATAPDIPGPTRSNLSQATATGPHCGPSFTYRGATIHSSKQRMMHGLVDGPPDLPGTWAGIGSVGAIVKVLDAWLGHRTLPAPYVLPREKKLRGGRLAGETCWPPFLRSGRRECQHILGVLAARDQNRFGVVKPSPLNRNVDFP